MTPLRLALLATLFLAAGCAQASREIAISREPSHLGRRTFEIACLGDVAFSPDGRLVAASDGRFLDVREAGSGERVVRINVREDAREPSGSRVAFSHDGTRLAVSSRGERDVVLCSAEDGRRLGRLSLDEGAVTALAFSPDDRRITVASSRGRLHELAIDVDELALDAPPASRRPVLLGSDDASDPEIGFLADAGDRLVVGNRGRSQTFVPSSPADGTEAQDPGRGDIPEGARYEVVAFDPATRTVAAVDALDGRVVPGKLGAVGAAAFEWGPPLGEPTAAGDVGGDERRVALDVARGRLAVTRRRSALGAVWHDVLVLALDDGRVLGAFQAGSVRALAFAPDGRTLAVSTGGRALFYSVAEIVRGAD